MSETVTVTSSRTGAYYTDIPADEAQAMCDEWNDGQGSQEWRVIWSTGE